MPEEIYSKIESKGAVQIFLSELKTIFNGKYRFDLPNREDKPMEFSNEYCLSVLDYDAQDVIEELVKIKSRDNKYVVCTSFHFPEREMNFPYINF